MADPLSITASLVAVITAAVASIKSLHETVSRFKGRDRTLGRLQNELQDTVAILDSLVQVVHTEASMAALLLGPIERCSIVCHEFAQSMESFSHKAKAGFRDWTKLEFMKGDINEFIDTISGYKSTISVGLGTITIQSAKVSQQVLQDYNEMIQDTVYDLKVHLQRVDEKLYGYTIDNPKSNNLTSSINLHDEREITKLCLRICEDARCYLDSVIQRESRIIQEPQNAADDDEQTSFEAQLLTRQTLDENRDSFAKIIVKLRNRLESVVLKNDSGDERERSRLMDDINTSKQCLEVCKAASEVSSQKIYRIGEVIAEGDSDQMVVTTLADLFDIKKAVSKGTSSQLVGSMADETLRHVSEKRYSSRFGTVAPKSDLVQAVNSSPSAVRIIKDKNILPQQMGRADESLNTKASQKGSSSNEVRRRVLQEEQK
ncbi:hypothetical protein GQ44DRAFT_733537 [Phaeosphaeriaceae sp. PMI808]|nr:hypothetical protein GQ44DRAFT_733537 [Phaeosphaeriaceae sp. PMI808]